MAQVAPAPVDESAWWKAHHQGVVAHVSRRCGPRHAEDAAARAGEKVLLQIRGGLAVANIGGYWARAAVNEAISMARVDHRALLTDAPPEPLTTATNAIDDLVEAAGRERNVEAVRRALIELQDSDRELLVARYVHEQSLDELATAAGASPRAVSMRLSRAADRLSDWFIAAHSRRSETAACRAVTAKLRRYHRGQLSDGVRARTDAHLAECRACTIASQGAVRLLEQVRGLGGLPVVFGLVVALRRMRQTTSRAGTTAVAGATALLVAAAAAVALVPGSSTQPLHADRASAPAASAGERDAGRPAGAVGVDAEHNNGQSVIAPPDDRGERSRQGVLMPSPQTEPPEDSETPTRGPLPTSSPSRDPDGSAYSTRTETTSPLQATMFIPEADHVPEPDPVHEPAPRPEPVLALGPEPSPEPVPVRVPEPEPEPEPALEPETRPELGPEAEPEAELEPTPEPELEPKPQPEPEPESEIAQPAGRGRYSWTSPTDARAVIVVLPEGARLTAASRAHQDGHQHEHELFVINLDDRVYAALGRVRAGNAISLTIDGDAGRVSVAALPESFGDDVGSSWDDLAERLLADAGGR